MRPLKDGGAYIGDERPPKCDDITLLVSELNGEITGVPARADVRPRRPDLPNKVVRLYEMVMVSCLSLERPLLTLTSFIGSLVSRLMTRGSVTCKYARSGYSSRI